MISDRLQTSRRSRRRRWAEPRSRRGSREVGRGFEGRTQAGRDPAEPIDDARHQSLLSWIGARSPSVAFERSRRSRRRIVGIRAPADSRADREWPADCDGRSDCRWPGRLPMPADRECRPTRMAGRLPMPGRLPMAGPTADGRPTADSPTAREPGRPARRQPRARPPARPRAYRPEPGARPARPAAPPAPRAHRPRAARPCVSAQPHPGNTIPPIAPILCSTSPG